MTLEADIKTYIDRAAPAIPLDEIMFADRDMYRPGHQDTTGDNHRSPRAPSLLVAAAAIGILVVTALVVTDPFPADETVLATGPPVSPLVAGVWENIGDPTAAFVPSDVVDSLEFGDTTELGASQILVSAITATADGYVAVGSEQVGFVDMAALWSTSDGQTWERIDLGSAALGDLAGERDDWVPPGFRIEDVAAAGNRIVAVGSESRDGVAPTSWTSTGDGEWQRIALPVEVPGFVSATSIVSTSTGFVVLGSDNRDLNNGSTNLIPVWLSADGINWSAVANPGFEAGDIVSDIETFDDRVIAVGTSGGFSEPRAAAWVSDDAGQTWTEATLPEPPADRPVTQIVDVAAGPEGVVAIGHQAINGDTSWGQQGEDGPRTLGDQQDIIVWSTLDGTKWEQASELRTPEQLTIKSSITAGPGGYLVSFTTITEDATKASSWITLDGSQLRQIDHPHQRSLDVAASFADHYVSITSPVLGADWMRVSEPAPPLQVWQLPFTR